MASQTKTLQVKIAGIRERVHQPWRDALVRSVMPSLALKDIFNKELFPKYPIGDDMAKIENLYDRSISPETLRNILAHEFEIDPRDISCERVNKIHFRPSLREKYDGMIVPFLIMREEPKEEFFEILFKRATELQGINLGSQLKDTARQVSRSYFNRRLEEEEKTKNDTVCPKCQTRLRKTEQRRKDHVLVTLTCPNRPWCKWGTSRIVPLTGPRKALALSVDREEDLETEKPEAPALTTCGGLLTLSTGCDPGAGPVYMGGTSDPRPGRIRTEELSCESMTIRAQNVKEGIVTGIDPSDWSTWPAGTIVTHAFSGDAKLLRFEKQRWVARCSDGREAGLVDGWKVKQWDWRNWKPGAMVLSQKFGACRLEKYNEEQDAWSVTELSEHYTMTLVLREETMLDEPVDISKQDRNFKKEPYYPAPEVGMQVILTVSPGDWCKIPLMSTGKIADVADKKIRAKFNTPDGEISHSWLGKFFWSFCMTLEAYIKNEWVQFHDELYVGLELEAVIHHSSPTHQNDGSWKIGSRWVIEDSVDTGELRGIRIKNIDSGMRLLMSNVEIGKHFVPVPLSRG